MKSLTTLKISTALMAMAFAAPSLAQAPSAATPPSARTLPAKDCFNSRDWRGWKSPSPDTLYIRVGLKDVYRIDLRGGGRALDAPNNFIVSVARGGTRVCSTVDLDLRMSDNLGFVAPLFPTGLVKLTPQQIEAIPPKFRP